MFSVGRFVYRLSMVRLLIERGADVNSRDENGWTPCHTASQGGHLDVVKLLLQHGTAVEVRQSSKRLWPWRRHRAVSELRVTSSSAVPMSILVMSMAGLGFTRHQGMVITISHSLLDHSADVNTQKDDRWTSLHLAAGNGNIEVVQLHGERGANMTIRNEKKETPLELAVTARKLDIVRLLAGRQALFPMGNGNLNDRPSPQNRGKSTDVLRGTRTVSLHRASEIGDVDIVKFLLDHVQMSINGTQTMKHHWIWHQAMGSLKLHACTLSALRK
jgi:ankyrin repeat protein